jgi:hypothetical protein
MLLHIYLCFLVRGLNLGLSLAISFCFVSLFVLIISAQCHLQAALELALQAQVPAQVPAHQVEDEEARTPDRPIKRAGMTVCACLNDHLR